MPVVSFDCNRFTLDAAFGDYFDGETFRPHPVGGYDRCIIDSVKSINKLWASYELPVEALWNIGLRKDERKRYPKRSAT